MWQGNVKARVGQSGKRSFGIFAGEYQPARWLDGGVRQLNQSTRFDADWNLQALQKDGDRVLCRGCAGTRRRGGRAAGRRGLRTGNALASGTAPLLGVLSLSKSECVIWTRPAIAWRVQCCRGSSRGKCEAAEFSRASAGRTQ